MARIRALAPFDAPLAGLDEVDAPTLLALVREIDQRSPGFADAAPLKAAFAVDGEIWLDWSRRLPDDAEVIVLPRIAGGQDVGGQDTG